MPHGEYPDADKGKCRFCGFLSKHAISPSDLPSPRFYEAEHSERITVKALYQHALGRREPVFTEPMCFLGEINPTQLILSYGMWETERKLAEEIIKDRHCEKWVPYMPGFDPKEHYERLAMQQLEIDRRKFEERLANRDEEVHTALVKAEHAFQLERERVQEPTQNLMKRLTVLAVLLGILQVAVGLSPDSLIVKAIVRIWRYIFG